MIADFSQLLSTILFIVSL